MTTPDHPDTVVVPNNIDLCRGALTITPAGEY